MKLSEYNHYPNGECIKEIPATVHVYTFSNYDNNSIITDSKKKNNDNVLFATSGQLICKEDVDKIKKAFTSTHNFRMLMNFYNHKKIAFTDSSFSIVAKIINMHKPQEQQTSIPEWSGIHLFGRYQSENNLYVVSFRVDNTIVMKKKINGEYFTLKSVKNTKFSFYDEHNFLFQIIGNTLIFYIDGENVISTKDLDLLWGTHGIRTDYCDVFITSITIS